MFSNNWPLIGRNDRYMTIIWLLKTNDDITLIIAKVRWAQLAHGRFIIASIVPALHHNCIICKNK